MKSKYLTIGGLSALSVTIIANFGFADVSSDRLDAYKANKLIPNEVQIATINSVSTDATGVAVFSPDALSWKSYSNASSAALGKFMDWTREDFEAFFADPANEAGFEDAWKFLSQTGNDHLQGAAISDEDSLIVLQSQLDSLISSGDLSGKAFPCEGLDFTGRDLEYVNLSNCTGLTGEQLISASSLRYSTIPPVDFSGVDLTGKVLIGINGFHLVTGLTGEQLASAAYIWCLNLPAVDFTGVDLTGKNLSVIDFSKCTGLTAQQLLSGSSIYGSTLPAIDFSGVDLSGLDINSVDFSRCTGLTWDQITSASVYNAVALPSLDFSDISLSGMALTGMDFSKCTGLTAQNVLSASNLVSVKLPEVDFTNADLSGLTLRYMDLSNTTGLSWEQLSMANDITNISLPKMDLSNADMSGKNISGIDFTNCSGLTGNQLAKASDLRNISLTSAQYANMKASLPKGTYIYVDGIRTRIQ